MATNRNSRLGRPAFSDPGGEVVNAAIGTEDWAKRVRLELQSAVKDLRKAPERVRDYITLMHEHRAWTMLNKDDGTRFRSFEEFCEYKYPWGLNRPYPAIKAYIEAAAVEEGKSGKKVAALVGTPPARQGEREQGTSRPRDEKLNTSPTATRNRAILRAPAPIQALYTEDLISQKVAARLGPKAPTPEQAARVANVAAVVECLPRDRKLIDATVRRMLGEKEPSLYERVLALALRLTAEEQVRLREQLARPE